MKKTYNWETAKGAKIEVVITIQKVTYTETINADGDKVDVEKTKWQYTVDSLTVNGTVCQNSKYNHSNISLEINGKTAKIIVPQEIKDEIWAEERAELEARIDENRKWDADRKRIHDAMSY